LKIQFDKRRRYKQAYLEVLNIEIHKAGSHFHWTFGYKMLIELPLLFRYVNKQTIISSKLIITQNVTIIRSLCAGLFFCNKQKSLQDIRQLYCPVLM
jgi:hypothetical protein